MPVVLLLVALAALAGAGPAPAGADPSPAAGQAPGDAAGAPAPDPARRGPRIQPIPLPPPAPLGSPFERPAEPPGGLAGEPPPPEVAALLGRDRTLVEARRADLDLDGSPEWLLVARFLHPDRIEHGPRSAEWRAGQRIESRLTHELVIAGRERGAWRVRFAAELRGSERQALLVETLARGDGRPGRWPVVITGARACVGSCGPVELHLVVWDPARKAFGDFAWAGAELVQVTASRTVEAWFADRRPGDALCCPSGYTVMSLAAFGDEIDVRRQRTVPADRLRRLMLPGRLVERVEKGELEAAEPPPVPPRSRPPGKPAARPPAGGR